MFCDDRIAERFRPDVRKIVFALDMADSQLVRLDFILQPQMRHACFMLPIPCRKGMLSVAFVSMVNTGFSAKPMSHIMLWTLFASDAPNAAAYSASGDDLLLSFLHFQIMWYHERDSRACRFPPHFVSNPVRFRANCHFWTHVTECENLDPLSLPSSTERVASIL